MKSASLLLRTRRGSVTVLAATVLPVLVGMAGLTTEYGTALLTKVKMQRIADAAAYSGALAYNAAGTTDALNNAISRIATLNGIPASDLAASVVSSPTGDGNNAVQVTATSSVALNLSQLIRSGNSVTVSASAYAEMRSSANGVPCVIALNTSGTGVTLSGAGAISASACAVTSDNTITVPNGASITSPVVTYDSASAPSSTTLSNIHPPAGVTSVSIFKKLVSDPLASNTEVTSATSHLASVALQTAPSAPSPPSGSAASFQGSGPGSLPSGCSASKSGSTWTLTCGGNGPFNFGTISLGGGITLNFNTGGSSSATYNINGNIDGSSGSAMSFGPGTYNVSGGIIVGGGMTASFGAGTFNLGKPSNSCNSSTGYAICNTGTLLTFAGSSTFVMAGGIYTGGGSTTNLGTSTAGNTSPTSNSFNVGKANDGNSVAMGGSAKVTFADTTGGSGIFQMGGNFTSAGGSCLVVSAAANHDISGSINMAGGSYLGAGIYSVTGYVALGAGGGGDVTCTVNGTSQSLGMSGSGVAFAIGASTTPSSGSCSSTAFCVAAGYGHVTLTAPTSGTMKNLVVVGPTSSSNTAGGTFAEGATNTSLSGAFYFPYGPFTMSGGASVGSGTGQCLEVIASQVTLSGGTAVASTCVGLVGPSVAPGGIALVQ